jgi:putative phosphoesterase
MRLAVLSDIHGNLTALEAVLNDIKNAHVDGFIVAGDLTIGCPQPVEVVQRLRSLPAWIIRGNNEGYLQQYHDRTAPAEWYTCQQWAPTRWNYHHMNQETIDFLLALPEHEVIQVDSNITIRVVHATPDSPSKLLFPDKHPQDLHEALAQVTESVMVCGHTHLPWMKRHGHQLAINPGAVSFPLNGHIGAQYALLTWREQQWEIEHRAIPYDLNAARSAFEYTGFLAEVGALGRAMLLTLETGQDVFLDFLSYAYELARQAGLNNCKIVPDDIWERAHQTFNWTRYTRS